MSACAHIAKQVAFLSCKAARVRVELGWRSTLPPPTDQAGLRTPFFAKADVGGPANGLGFPAGQLEPPLPDKETPRVLRADLLMLFHKVVFLQLQIDAPSPFVFNPGSHRFCHAF